MTVVEDNNIFWYEFPDSWDDAARKSISMIFSSTIGEELEELTQMRHLLDEMIRIQSAPDIEDEFADRWRILGACSRNVAVKNGILNNSPEAAAELSSLLIKKQKDYGHDNINRFGRIGLLVRVHDKIARLENLTRRGTNPQNESLRDNYMDVVNYCAIGIMVEMDWFMLEMADDLPAQ